MPDTRENGAQGSTPDPILINKVRLIGSVRSLVIVEWVLINAPDSGWIELFNTSPLKHRGSPGFVSGACGKPTVGDGPLIHWSVPHADLNNAASYVFSSVVFANARRAASPHFLGPRLPGASGATGPTGRRTR
jgi:hypothetical protein